MKEPGPQAVAALASVVMTLAALALAAPACSDVTGEGDAGGRECLRDSDCSGNLICRSGTCVPPERDVAVDPESDAEECLRPSDCPDEFRCLDNRCVSELDPDLGTDATPDLGGDALSDTGGDALSDVCTGSGCGPDGGGPDGPLECEGREDGRLGDSCDGASDCCNGLCLGDPEAGVGYCTARCADWDACNPVGFRDEYYCIDPGDSQRLCVFSDYQNACDVPENCIGQVCLKGQGTSGCSIQCRDRDDCRPGSACGAVYFPDGGGGFFALDVCSPIGGSCFIFETGFNNCLSGTCVTEEEGGLGFCTVFCSTARGNQCPPNWGCQIVEAGQPAICVPQ